MQNHRLSKTQHHDFQRKSPQITQIANRADAVASALLDEVFKDYLWQQRIAQHGQGAISTVFTARPPELTTAAVSKGITEGEWAIVHPEPPLAEEEQRLFADLLPNVRISTLNEWLKLKEA